MHDITADASALEKKTAVARALELGHPKLLDIFVERGALKPPEQLPPDALVNAALDKDAEKVKALLTKLRQGQVRLDLNYRVLFIAWSLELCKLMCRSRKRRRCARQCTLRQREGREPLVNFFLALVRTVTLTARFLRLFHVRIDSEHRSEYGD